MTASNEEERKLLAAMAYGEASALDDYEEMAAIASVLLRQRDARGYLTMQEFTKAEPTYSFVVKDGNKRYKSIVDSSLDAIKTDKAAHDKKAQDTRDKISKISNKTDKSSIKEWEKLNLELSKIEKRSEALAGKIRAFDAADNALSGGKDYSGGGFFWDGKDIQTNYKNHFKVKHGIKITDQSHNIYNIKDSEKTVIIYKIKTTKDKQGKTHTSKTEVGRYTHIYESTAGHGGTIFWKHNPKYMELTGAKEYK